MNDDLKKRLRRLTSARESGARRDPLAYVNRLLETSAAIAKFDPKRLHALQEIEPYLFWINEVRAKIGAVPLTLRTPRKILTDLKRVLDAEAMRECRELFLSGSGPGLWRRWIKSKDFLESSPYSPLYDECADLLIGLDERRIQRELRGHPLPILYRLEHSYLDLLPEDLFTPYYVLHHLISRFPRRAMTLVDLGSGLGRAGLVLLAMRPRARFIGYELVGPRARASLAAARALGLTKRFEVRAGDLSDLAIAKGDCYFFFNPFRDTTLRKVARGIRPHFSTETKVVTVTYGRPYYLFLRAPWSRREGRTANFPEWAGNGYQVFRGKKLS